MKQPCNTYAGCCQMTNAMCQAQCWREAGGGGKNKNEHKTIMKKLSSS